MTNMKIETRKPADRDANYLKKTSVLMALFLALLAVQTFALEQKLWIGFH